MILACTCVNAFQDALYGPGRRVHNQTRQNDPAQNRLWRCAVCGKEKTGPARIERERDE